MEVDIVDDHQIDKTVSVIVTECGASGPAPIGNASLGGHIGKSAIAVVTIKNVAAETSFVDVGPAIVVVIAHGAAHSKAASGQAGFCGHIRKCAVVIVVVKRAQALLP